MLFVNGKGKIMSRHEYKCDHCRTQYGYPENILELLERHLAKKGYKYVNLNGELYVPFPNGGGGGVYLSEDSSFFAKNLTVIMGLIAEKEDIQPSTLYLDITYDHIQYLKEQIYMYKHFIKSRNKGELELEIDFEEYTKRIEERVEQFEEHIEQLEDELDKELDREKKLKEKIQLHRGKTE